MADQHIPELTSSGVLTVRSSVVINAPKEKVWDVLLDFPSYGECRTQEVIGPDGKIPLLPQEPAPGRRLRLHVHVPPTSARPSTVEEVLTHVDDVHFRLAWRWATPARWLLHAERWQILRDAPGGGGTTVYETWEVIGGMLAYVARVFGLRAKLQASFDGMSDGLKERAERAAE
ncbi:hypothetical protein BC834DRAFT_394873 [Gloeopeniophorella convolvens]|nr:hypothetical protein BC834DRAFT_394873 [Gloeopeniophorella convolvens]